MLTGCKQEKEIRTTVLQKCYKHIGKQAQTALEQTPLFIFVLMVQCGLVVGPTGNPEPGFLVLPQTCCSGLTGLGQGFLIRQIGRSPHSVFISGKIANG